MQNGDVEVENSSDAATISNDLAVGEIKKIDVVDSVLNVADIRLDVES